MILLLIHAAFASLIFAAAADSAAFALLCADACRYCLPRDERAMLMALDADGALLFHDDISYAIILLSPLRHAAAAATLLPPLRAFAMLAAAAASR